MIKFIKSWCEGIIVAVIISIIIEMIVPDGNNKKYIKVVVGIYMIFVILNPILEKLNFDCDINNIFEMEFIEVSADLDNNIKDVYVDGIEDTIKNDLIEKGYYVYEVKIDVDNNYENIKKIQIKLSEKNKNEIYIEPVIIGEKEKETQNYMDIKNYISENYQIEIENIYIIR